MSAVTWFLPASHTYPAPLPTWLSSTLKLVAALSSEKVVTTLQSTQCHHNPEDYNPNLNCSDSLRSSTKINWVLSSALVVALWACI
jgi:hypothetical protein